MENARFSEQAQRQTVGLFVFLAALQQMSIIHSFSHCCRWKTWPDARTSMLEFDAAYAGKQFGDLPDLFSSSDVGKYAQCNETFPESSS